MKLFSTEQTDVHLLVGEYAKNLQLYLVNNRAHLAPYEPLRDDEYFALENIQNRIINSLNDYQEKRSLLLVVTL
ncbi:TPA: GNAT family N-acetyltransferase, partial [Serratia marcescens]